MIQYSVALVMERSFAAYWIPAFRGNDVSKDRP
jgi:hypothetical protein